MAKGVNVAWPAHAGGVSKNAVEINTTAAENRVSRDGVKDAVKNRFGFEMAQGVERQERGSRTNEERSTVQGQVNNERIPSKDEARQDASGRDERTRK